MASSLGCSTSSSSSFTSSALGISSGNGSGVETSSDEAFTRVSETGLSSFLEEDGGRVGFVTLFAEVRGPKARVCWAERGLEDLRREGGMMRLSWDIDTVAFDGLRENGRAGDGRLI